MAADQQYDDQILPGTMPIPPGYIMGPNGYPIPDVPPDVRFEDLPPGYPEEMQGQPEGQPGSQPGSQPESGPAPGNGPITLPGFIPRPEAPPPTTGPTRRRPCPPV